MISHIKGTLKRKCRGNRMLLDVHGVGYEVVLPFFVMRAFDAAKEEEEGHEGDEINLEIYYHVTSQQPRPILIGFKREYEKTFFEKLIRVQGVGPTVAAEALVFSVSAVAKAIAKGDVEFLTRMPKIGQKTAKKIIGTLQDDVAQWALLQDEGYDQIPPVGETARDAAIDVLVGLEYKRTEAREHVEAVLRRSPKLNDPQDILREVFRAAKG